MTIVGLEPT